MTERPTGQPERRRGTGLGQNPLESLPRVTTTLRISGVHQVFIDSIAEIEGVTGGDVIRKALDDYIQKKRGEYEGKRGKKNTLAKKIEEVTVYSQGLERVLGNLRPPKPPKS